MIYHFIVHTTGGYSFPLHVFTLSDNFTSFTVTVNNIEVTVNICTCTDDNRTNLVGYIIIIAQVARDLWQ